MAKAKHKNPHTRQSVSQAETSKAINEWIVKNSGNYPTWEEVTKALNKALGCSLSQSAISKRGAGLKVAPAGRQFRRSPSLPDSTDPLKQNILKFVLRKKNVQPIEVIANAVDASPARVRKALEELNEQGHTIIVGQNTVELSHEIPKQKPTRIDASRLGGKVYKFGFTTDNHLASKYERLDVLNALYDIYEREGVTTVYNGGNMIEGDARFNRQEVIVTGMEAQCTYLAKNWPQRKGITTYYVTGDDHEGWYTQREGVEIGKYMENCFKEIGRNDCKYVGHMEHDFQFKGRKTETVLRLLHAGGGSSYATSYSAQKIVESYQGGEKPHVLLIGHYHKAEYGYPREVHCVQGGCTVDQTSFMRKKKIQAHVGGWIIEMTIHPDGHITRFKQEWIGFYDRGFYDKAWKYPRLAA